MKARSVIPKQSGRGSKKVQKLAVGFLRCVKVDKVERGKRILGRRAAGRAGDEEKKIAEIDMRNRDHARRFSASRDLEQKE